jgi:cytochrome b subunit of formate dehydrogenase
MYRPPSRSESFIYENREKGSYFDLSALPSPPPPPPPEPPPPQRLQLLHFLYPFLFHITLISLFETIFFFTYVSTLEDKGILNTIQDYVNPLLQGCTNWTTADRIFALDILTLFLNTTTLPPEAAAAAAHRAAINATLFNRSWIYVGGLASTTTVFTGILIWNQSPPPWKKLLTEQLSMVLLLGVYEWIFFRTIVLPYKAISATEVNQYVVQELDSICNL